MILHGRLLLSVPLHYSLLHRNGPNMYVFLCPFHTACFLTSCAEAVYVCLLHFRCPVMIHPPCQAAIAWQAVSSQQVSSHQVCSHFSCAIAWQALLTHPLRHLWRPDAGDWFCSEDCNKVWQALNGRAAAGPSLVDTPGYILQVMRGHDTSGTAAAQATNDAIATAQQVREPLHQPHAEKYLKRLLGLQCHHFCCMTSTIIPVRLSDII